MNVAHPAIRAFPMGLADINLRRGLFEKASEAIASASLDAKPHMLLAAWGKHFELEDVNPNRKSATVWAQSDAAQEVGVHFRTVAVDEWWSELAKYKFMMSPYGVGIQSAKTVEALLVLTIPIVVRISPSGVGTPGLFDHLLELGFPIVVVDKWVNISSSRLHNWWATVSPRMLSFRRNCLTADGFWHMLTAQPDRCE
eukprot:gnl/TRDRNA2_/TRDRNA2_155444_c0_seq2.p1 gnl/TRDRNA2_/TRDRNA2_155444_c0~~gnl/TRDRNA2_/TRDRNA2_155444_c0_seq2.p1  ORF type:complete len:198 (+),score=11.53 gnl/TRDRNA2_/TRDRNA2_155444_c0_seq2:143-736(+)